MCDIEFKYDCAKGSCVQCELVGIRLNYEEPLHLNYYKCTA